MKRHWVGRAGTFLILALLAATIMSAVVMSLWNWLMPALFELPVITFWQALGLLVLSRILFGRFGGHGRGRHWRHRMRERWNHLTPDERETFTAGMRGRCERARSDTAMPAETAGGGGARE